MGYQIFTDATADLNEELLMGLPNLEIIPMEVMVGGGVYTYGPNGNLTVKQFYNMQREGAFASTTQISPETYRTCFEDYLKKGQCGQLQIVWMYVTGSRWIFLNI